MRLEDSTGKDRQQHSTSFPPLERHKVAVLLRKVGKVGDTHVKMVLIGDTHVK